MNSNNYFLMKVFEAFTVVMFQVNIFWAAMPYSAVVGCQHFRGPCCLHLQGEIDGSSMDIWNVSILPQQHTASQPRGPWLEATFLLYWSHNEI